MVRRRLLKVGLGLAVAAIVAACQKEAPPPPQKAEAPKPPPEVVVKIGQVSPLTGPQAHLGKDNDNGAQARDRGSQRERPHDRRREGKVRAGERGRPGRSQDRHDRRAEARRRQGRRRDRSLEFRHDDTRVQDLQRRRHTADLALGDQSQVHRAGLQGRVPRDGERRPAGQGAGRVRGRTVEAPRKSPSSTIARPTARGSPTSSRRRRRRAALPSSDASTPPTRQPISGQS